MQFSCDFLEEGTVSHFEGRLSFRFTQDIDNRHPSGEYYIGFSAMTAGR